MRDRKEFPGRYIVWIAEEFYPCGGPKDFIGSFDSLIDATLEYQRHISLNEGERSRDYFGGIYDQQQRVVVEAEDIVVLEKEPDFDVVASLHDTIRQLQSEIKLLKRKKNA